MLSPMNFAALILLLPPLPPSAQQAPQAPKSETCISDAQAKKCLEALKTHDLLVEYLNTTKQDLLSHDVEISLLKQDTEAVGLALKDWQQRYHNSQDSLSQCTQDLGAWYHNPVIMGAVGFIGGVALTTAGVVLLTHH